MRNKRCKKCVTIKCILLFEIGRAVCKSCRLKQKREYTVKNIEKIKKYRKLNRQKNIESKIEYRSKNKEKIINYSKQYRAKNKSVIKKNRNKIHNKEKAASYNKAYYKANKIKFSEKSKEYNRIKRKINPAFRLRELMSARIGRALSLRKSSKNHKSILTYLPYSFIDLCNYIESLFKPWMNWTNYGVYRSDKWKDDDSATWTWQLDHIVPHSTFNYNNMECDEFYKCWSLSNLRPLSAKQNQLDGATRSRHAKQHL